MSLINIPTRIRTVDPKNQDAMDELTKQYDLKHNLLDAVATELDPEGDIAMNTPFTDMELELFLQENLEPETKIDWRLHDQLLNEVKVIGNQIESIDHHYGGFKNGDYPDENSC